MSRDRLPALTYLAAVTVSAVVTVAALYGLFRIDLVGFAEAFADGPIAAIVSSPAVLGLTVLGLAGLGGLIGSVVVLGARAVEPRDQ